MYEHLDTPPKAEGEIGIFPKHEKQVKMTSTNGGDVFKNDITVESCVIVGFEAADFGKGCKHHPDGCGQTLKEGDLVRCLMHLEMVGGLPLQQLSHPHRETIPHV